jgi:hypothetical protein
MKRTGQGLMSVLVLVAAMAAGCSAGSQAIFASSAEPPGVSSIGQ